MKKEEESSEGFSAVFSLAGLDCLNIPGLSDWQVHGEDTLHTLERRIQDILRGIESFEVPDDDEDEDRGGIEDMDEKEEEEEKESPPIKHMLIPERRSSRGDTASSTATTTKTTHTKGPGPHLTGSQTPSRAHMVTDKGPKPLESSQAMRHLADDFTEIPFESIPHYRYPDTIHLLCPLPLLSLLTRILSSLLGPISLFLNLISSSFSLFHLLFLTVGTNHLSTLYSIVMFHSIQSFMRCMKSHSHTHPRPHPLVSSLLIFLVRYLLPPPPCFLSSYLPSAVIVGAVSSDSYPSRSSQRTSRTTSTAPWRCSRRLDHTHCMRTHYRR